MGWASGIGLLDEVWTAIAPLLPEDKKADVADGLVEAFKNYDCDTIYESEHPELVEAEKRRYPDLYDDEDEAN